MKGFQILVADNRRDTLAIYKDFIEDLGYKVLTVQTPEDAEKYLLSRRIHLVLTDLRMRNDNDEMDRSGLILAKTVARFVPKLIVTNFPAYQDVVEALKPESNDLPPAVDFVNKAEGIEALGMHIEQALKKYVRINWSLIIKWQRPLELLTIGRLINPNHNLSQLDELEDLLRQIFFQNNQITVTNLLLEETGRVLLGVHAFNEAGFITQHVVSLGEKELVEEEYRRYKQGVPNITAIRTLRQLKTAASAHFFGINYEFCGGDLEETQSFINFYKSQPATKIFQVLDNLYGNNLDSWYRQGRVLEKNETIEAFYLREVTLFRNLSTLRSLQIKVETICNQALALNIGRCEIKSDSLILHFPTGNIILPNPIINIGNENFRMTGETQWGLVNGNINFQTVLVNNQNETWLIDYTRVQKAPLLHDFVTLESALKCQYPFVRNLDEIYKYQSILCGKIKAEEVISFGDSNLAKAFKTILTIRNYAYDTSGCSHENYLVALYYISLCHLDTFQPKIYYTRDILLSYVDALVSMGLIFKSIDPINTLTFNVTQQTFFISGRPLELTLTESRLLQFLFEHRGEVCTRANIAQGVFDVIFPQEMPASERNQMEAERINTFVSRVRQAISKCTGGPHYITSVRGIGYRLESTQ